MDSQAWRRVEEIYHATSAAAEAEREDLLAELCGADADIRAEVESLLRQDPDSQLLDRAGKAVATRLLDSLARKPDYTSIGPYRVLREIGAGGMGRVFLAEREDLPKKVALKLVREPLLSPERVRRFEAEQRIVARLTHPGIAQFTDAGVTPDGSPFFAMEYVEGDPITSFADARRLSIDERLELFDRVCESVQYAHANLVVHRDLKPSNILVTAEGHPKLLDFGIAKLLGAVPGEETLTRDGGRVLSLPYAAPEQVTGDPISTRTDVYLLGVLLYELLAGRPPYGSKLKETDLDTFQKLQERLPVPPSAAIGVTGSDSSDASTPDRVGRARRSRPRELRRLLSGDLDLIVGKALEFEPARRYDSVSAFRDDLRRYRSGLPILARAPSRTYRFGKFVRRNRAGVGLVALLVIYAGSVTWQSARLSAQRDRAQLEAARAAQVSDFVIDLFKASDPSGGSADSITAREILESGVARADSLAAQPDLHATLLHVIGQVFLNLGEHVRSAELFRRALTIREQVPGARDEEQRTETMFGLALALSNQDAFEPAAEMFRDVIASRRRLQIEDDVITLRALEGLWATLHSLGDQEKADSVLAEREASLAAYGPATDPHFASTLVREGEVLIYRRDFERAERLIRQGIAVFAELGSEHDPARAAALNVLAVLLLNGERPLAADSVTREALAMHRRLYPRGNGDFVRALNQRARLLKATSALEEAEVLLREALAMSETIPNDGYGRVVMVELGYLLYELGHHEEAILLMKRSATEWEESRGPAFTVTWKRWVGVAEMLRQQSKFGEAEELLLANYEIVAAQYELEHRYPQLVIRQLVELYSAWEKLELAAEYRALLEPSLESAPGPGS